MNNRHIQNMMRPRLSSMHSAYSASTLAHSHLMHNNNPHNEALMHQQKHNQYPNGQMMMFVNPAVNIANPLNSSLVLRKGKERENPRKKKPSTLKKVA